MEWLGKNLKDLLETMGVTQAGLATELGVSRQTVVDWLKGQVPKGTHLLQLCQILDIYPNILFVEGSSSVQVKPLHRRRLNAKLTPEMQQAACRMAEEYAFVLNAEDMPILTPVVHGDDRQLAIRLAAEMRRLVGLDGSEAPLDYRHAFALLYALKICVIFRRFPTDIKDYAFYTVVNGQKAVFVNSDTNILDLIFPLLHEGVHAVRGSRYGEDYEEAEELFCDRVAGLVQFPNAYVDDVYSAIKGRTSGVKINMLKDYALRHNHTIFGITRRINEKYPRQSLPKPHGADGNLRGERPTIGNVLMSDGASSFVELLGKMSPIWLNVVSHHAETITTGRLAELLDLESVIDARLVKDELLAWRHREVDGCSV